jgi:NADH-quinone oxidoreductase subunit J
MDADLQQMLAYPAYGLYLLIILAGGVLAVGSASLVRALLGLILTLFGVAGMYLLMNAPFVAFMQLLIYVGAVSVLIFFAIMLTKVPGGEAGGEAPPKLGGRLILAALTGLVPAGILAGALIKVNPQILPLKPETSLLRLGEFLAGPYALAFELISVVLFAAMAGAVLLGFERRKGR